MELVKIELLKPDPNQPRKVIDERSVEKLSRSLATEGLINPIEVDKDYMIITGELRWRASKLLGLKEVSIQINQSNLSPYERLRRQMAENLHQSGVKGGGEAMNPMDTARGWQNLISFLLGKDYVPGTLSRHETYGFVKRLREEVGVDDHTIWEYLRLLEQPEIVKTAIQEGTPRTYLREIERAPEEFRGKLQEKMVAGDFNSREDITRTVNLIKKEPDLAIVALNRQLSKENVNVNRILNLSASLAVALVDMPLNSVEKERNIVIQQLKYLLEKIELYLESGDVN